MVYFKAVRRLICLVQRSKGEVEGMRGMGQESSHCILGDWKLLVIYQKWHGLKGLLCLLGC